MKLIANGINGQYLQNILSNAPDDLEWVKAAVAYVDNSSDLLSFCRGRKVNFSLIGRLDEKVAVACAVLKQFLDAPIGFECRLVTEFFHPKVIWFGNYGVYIGSANLTSRAWTKNIEAGVWIDHAELVRQGMLAEIDDFFIRVESHSQPLTSELYQSLSKIEGVYGGVQSSLSKQENLRRKQFEDTVLRILPNVFQGLTMTQAKKAKDARKMIFFEEWNATLTLLRKIQNEISRDEYRPDWVKADVPKGVQVDQFLHAFYYMKVKTGNRSEHTEFFERNRDKPDHALKNAMAWWKGLDAAPADEAEFMYDWAPFLTKQLHRSVLQTVDESIFVEICRKLHSFRTAARQTTNKELGLSEGTVLSQAERIELVAKWIWASGAGNGSKANECLFHVLYGGSLEHLVERVWESAFDADGAWHLPRFGLSCLGELVGWALPNDYPPRNGRTSKALRALGFDVKVYSE